jgi:hypothetical protein
MYDGKEASSSHVCQLVVCHGPIHPCVPVPQASATCAMEQCVSSPSATPTSSSHSAVCRAPKQSPTSKGECCFRVTSSWLATMACMDHHAAEQGGKGHPTHVCVGVVCGGVTGDVCSPCCWCRSIGLTRQDALKRFVFIQENRWSEGSTAALEVRARLMRTCLLCTTCCCSRKPYQQHGGPHACSLWEVCRHV